MTAREEITSLIHAYAFLLDTGDLNGFARLFANGEWTVEGLEPNVGEAAVLKAISSVNIFPDGTPRTKHLVGNIELSIDEAAGSANGQCYIVVFQQAPDFQLQPIFAGHYFDEFRRSNSGWHFTRRIIRHPLPGNLGRHISNSHEAEAL